MVIIALKALTLDSSQAILMLNIRENCIEWLHKYWRKMEDRTVNKKITFFEAMLTAVGLVIGSGIFFRADNILKLTEGNISVAISGWVVLGFTLIFAGIGMSILAARSQREGGIIAYMEDCFGKTAAFLTGWFTTFIYIPTLIGILSIIASGYVLQFFGVESNAMNTHTLAACLILIVFAWNYFSTKFAALFSSVATIVKLLPIVIIGVIGFAHFDGAAVSSGIDGFSMPLFTAPLLSMAFAFDGWTTVATLSKDMENPQRDIAKVLALNAVIVTAAYTLYFTGISMLLPAPEIIALGDDHVGVIAAKYLGNIGGKMILFCVVISVLGTLNGNVMAGYRYPHALAQAQDLPNSNYFNEESKYGTTGKAAMISFGAVVAWFIMYTIQAFSKQSVAEGADYMLSGIAFDDIPIMAIAFIITILLIGAMIYGNKEKLGILKSIIAPLIGILGQAYVVISFVQTNNAAFLYMGICIVIIVIGYFIRKSVKLKQTA